MRLKTTRAATLALMLLTLIILMAGCNTKKKPVATKASQMNDLAYTIGVPSGATAVNAVESALPKAKMKYYNSLPDAYLAVQQGKVDAFAFDKYLLGFAIANGLDGVKVLPGDVGATDDVAVGISRKSDIPDLQKKINDCLSKLKSDGTLDDMFKRWVVNADDTMPDIPKAKHPTMTLKVGTSGLVQPFSYYKGKELTGYDLELSARLAFCMNAKLVIKTYDYDGFPSAAESGAIDCILANLNATAERRETMDFSTPLYKTQTALLVKGNSTKESVKKQTADSETQRVPLKTAHEIASTSAVSFDTARYGLTSVVAQDYITGKYPNAKISMFASAADAMLALQSGKIDYVMTSRSTAFYMMKQNTGLKIARDGVLNEACYIGVSKQRPDLKKKVDAVLTQFKGDGTLDKLNGRWVAEGPDYYRTEYIPKAKGKNGVLKVALSPDAPPICFVQDGKCVGINVELIQRIAQKLDMTVEFFTMDFDALLPAIQSGKVDLALSDINATKERRKLVDFTQSYFANPQVLVTKQETVTDTSEPKYTASPPISKQAKKSFIDNLKASFTRTFLKENRWKLILDGLKVTVIISIFAGLLGSLMGFGICMLRRSKKRFASIPAAIFIRIIQGTPIVVLLMILYYIVFGKLDISAILVAIFGFAVNFGVYVSEMMRTGIDTVDKGQIEAAHALGFNKFKTFWKITFPQAARHFLPVFKGEFISMVKMTSIVGYIAIQDLTKVSDIIRSRTLEAFFPLIATAVIYFLVANILTMLLSRIEIKLDPKRRKRTVKGVVMK